jgi:hypothetical protein
MDETIRFVARLLEGERMAELCRAAAKRHHRQMRRQLCEDQLPRIRSHLGAPMKYTPPAGTEFQIETREHDRNSLHVL